MNLEKMVPAWKDAFLFLFKNLCAEVSDLETQLMDLATSLQRRAVEVVVYKISLLIGHWKAYLKVGEVDQGAEAEGGVDAEEEGVTGNLVEWCSHK